jgi:hypothetical protein
MPSFVIVWEQNMYLQKEIGGREWPGHAALNIGTHFDPKSFTPDYKSALSTDEQYDQFKKALKLNYVSYWPNTVGATFGLADVFGKRSKARCNRSVADDIAAEGYLPDWVIRLDTDAQQEQAMLAEWATVRDKPKGTYGAFKKNCSTIVSRVLHAGGFYAKKWAVNCNWVWAPGDVRRLALKAGGTPLDWATFQPILAAGGILPAHYGNKDFARDAAYNHIGVPSKFNLGTKVAGVGGNPIPE